MDSKVADFFKEIDALTVPEELIEEAYKNSAVLETETVKHSTIKDASKAQSDVTTLQKKEISCPWQEIRDDSSGYSYYWNVHTNEVTWECPQEYALYIQSTLPAERNSGKKSKNEKKKKETPSPPVGAIIPISYYGNSSSSEESSDIEKDAPKPPEKPTKVATVKKNRLTKKLPKDKSDKKGSSDVIGPQLPPDFQFPVSIPLSPHGNSEPKATENVEGVASALGSLDQSEQSNCNRRVASPSHEIAASTLDEKSGLGKDINKESHDGVLKKGENGLDEKPSVQPTNSVFALRPVVDYDSFTDDEDEEPDTSNASPPRTLIEDEVKLDSAKPELKKEEVVSSTETVHLFPIISEQKTTEVINTKRKVEEDVKENPVKPEPVKKLRKNDVNIDKLFAAHTTYGKHGFGFGWQSQPDNSVLPGFGLESEPDSRTQKGQSGKTPIAFIKSSDVLDLNLLNDDSNLAQLSDEKEEIEEEKPSSTAEEVEMEETPTAVVEEPDVPIESNEDCKDKVDSPPQAVILKGEHGDIVINKRRKENNSNEKIAHAVELASLDIEEDIDEIDRALNAALEAKKAAKQSQKSSPVSASVDLKTNHEPSSVKMPINSSDSDKDSDSDVEKEREAMLEQSSDAIDKLTFLLSNHTALASTSHNAFLVQLQTRFEDWKAKALDTKYFTARLKEVQDYLRNYEAGIVTGDWTCQWDRINKRYFYVNKTTQVSQWTYPEDSSQSEADSPLNSPSYKYLHNTPPKNPKTPYYISGGGLFASSPPPPPPGVDSPPPLPHTPPPDRLPPPPPDITTRRGDPEDMDLENSNDFLSLPFILKKNVGYCMGEDGEPVYIVPVPMMSPKSSPELVYDPCADRGPSQISFEPVVWPEEVEMNSHSSSIVSQTEPSRPKTSKAANTGVKKEKKKKKLQLGIGLKKKNLPSLVEKWLKIKEEQEKEDNDSEVLKSDSAL